MVPIASVYIRRPAFAKKSFGEKHNIFAQLSVVQIFLAGSFVAFGLTAIPRDHSQSVELRLALSHSKYCKKIKQIWHKATTNHKALSLMWVTPDSHGEFRDRCLDDFNKRVGWACRQLRLDRLGLQTELFLLFLTAENVLTIYALHFLFSIDIHSVM